MTENEPESKPKSRGGRPPKHGGFSIIAHGRHPESRRLRSYLGSVRAGLVYDLGPSEDDLSTAQRVTIDRCITYLGAARAIEEWVSSQGFMNNGVLNPSISEIYLSFCSGILKCLKLLGFDRRHAEKIIDLGQYKEAKIREKAKRSTSKAGGKHVETDREMVL